MCSCVPPRPAPPHTELGKEGQRPQQGWGVQGAPAPIDSPDPQVSVGEGSHPEKVRVYGPGVEKTGLKASEPTYFTVDCSEAGQGEATGSPGGGAWGPGTPMPMHDAGATSPQGM